MELVEERPITKDEFKFYVPLDIEKAEDETDIESKYKSWVLGGVASTGKKDSQGETLSPENYDLSDFKWVCWEHERSPDSIVGEVIKAYVEDNKLYIQVKLFPDSKKAKEIWELAKNLKKSNNGNSLSFSVEGSVVERDSNNPKKITRAKLTGVAICKTPVNGDTFASLIEKGYTEEKPNEKRNYVTLGGVSYEAYLDEDGNPQIRELEKTMTTAETEPVQKESVEGRVRYTNPHYNKKNLTKSEVYSQIFNQYNGITIPHAKEIFKLVQKVKKNFNNMAQEENEFSQETLNKAYQLLDLAENEQNKDKFSKAKKYKKAEKEEEEEYEEEEEGKGEEMEKTGKKMKKAKLSTQEDIDAEIKRLQEVKDEMMQNEQGDVKEYNTSNQMTKAVKDQLVNDIASKTEEQINKSLEGLTGNIFEKMTALGTILKSERERNDENQEKLQKAYEQIDNMDNIIKSLGERLNIVEKTPQERKSMQDVGYKERFDKAEGAEQGGKKLSVSQNRQEVLNLLEDRSGIFNKSYGSDFNEKETMYSQAITEFEGQGTLSKAVLQDLKKDGYVIIK